ncbi:helix-turn-helix transcriptional regulator [Paenibacillus amylolyticus]|uniref:AraC family transcriptional regulator n=1 Tax=Paenibacillus amylolyticus TaxID=1451 RepID=A0A100VLV9_PAEAM|nr:AraC family transcriptional regulator [Paenibacillus amylolyticus]GAS82131.1 AraC family transcriptional regulator [Paenibacillus amylolyticus]
MKSVSVSQSKYHVANEQFSIQHMKRAGITAMPRAHSHPFVELYYLKEGERIYFVDSQVVTLQKGEIILIQSDEMHATASSEIAEFERILINYNPALLPTPLQDDTQWFNKHGFHLFRLMLREQNEAENLLIRMVEECQECRPFYETSVLTLFAELMILLQRTEPLSQSDCTKHPLHNLVTDVATYIREHYEKPLTLEETARQFFISSSYLSRIFYRLTGFHFREYVVHIRIQQAKRLITQSNSKIQDIASHVGFEHLSHFNKTFKRVTGYNPSHYRKEIKFSQRESLFHSNKEL